MNRDKLHEIRVCLFYISPFILLLALLFGAVRWRDVKGSLWLDSATLSQTTGKITESKVNCECGRYGKVYHYEIRYGYEVDGHRFESDAVSFSDASAKSRNMADEYVKKYPVGSSVTVFYEDGNPSFAVLEPENKDSGFLIGCGILLALGLLLPVALIPTFRYF